MGGVRSQSCAVEEEERRRRWETAAAIVGGRTGWGLAAPRHGAGQTYLSARVFVLGTQSGGIATASCAAGRGGSRGRCRVHVQSGWWWLQCGSAGQNHRSSLGLYKKRNIAIRLCFIGRLYIYLSCLPPTDPNQTNITIKHSAEHQLSYSQSHPTGTATLNCVPHTTQTASSSMLLTP